MLLLHTTAVNLIDHLLGALLDALATLRLSRCPASLWLGRLGSGRVLTDVSGVAAEVFAIPGRASSILVSVLLGVLARIRLHDIAGQNKLVRQALPEITDHIAGGRRLSERGAGTIALLRRGSHKLISMLVRREHLVVDATQGDISLIDIDRRDRGGLLVDLVMGVVCLQLSLRGVATG